MRPLLQLLYLCILAVPVELYAASFNCVKASTPVEKRICSDSELSSLDETLATLYQTIIAAPCASTALIPDQRRWLIRRNECPDRQCVTAAYNARIEELRSAEGARISSEPGVHEFAEKLYQVSAYTSEEAAIGDLISAELELVTSRWLAKRLAEPGIRFSDNAPARWEDMIKALRKAVAPVAKTHHSMRASALAAAGLNGRAVFVCEYEQMVSTPKDRGNIRFSDGSSASSQDDQFDDIPEILAFHETPAAAKWRDMWPKLRAYAARLTALHYRIDADPALGSLDKPWKERAVLLAGRIGGRVLAAGEWQNMTNERLGFTLSGLDRFLLPLGTEMRKDNDDSGSMSITERGSAIVITQHEGRRLIFHFLDAHWERDVTKKFSHFELEQIDNALTATYSKKKDRWFAPLELEWDAFLSVSRRIYASGELQKVNQSFVRQSEAAMKRVWATWQKI